MPAVNHSEDRLKMLMKEALEDHRSHLKETFVEAFNECATRCGLDIEAPTEQQADLAYLRRKRKFHENTGARTVWALITVAVTTLGAWLYAHLNMLKG